MFNNSRMDIYDYLYDLFFGVVTDNVYLMNEPTELTASDLKDGFIVISAGNLNDESEFTGNAYGWIRCYVSAYIPTKSRGRVDETLYKKYENDINSIISQENRDDEFYIQPDSVISSDIADTSNVDNQFYLFIKTFIVNTL